MAFEGLRSKLRSLADSGSDAAGETVEEVRGQAPERVREARRAAGGTARRVAPKTDLENNRQPVAPGSRKAIARRLQSSGQMRKPIGDANLAPGADPRFMEEFARGDATTGEWFGESKGEPNGNAEFFASESDDLGYEYSSFASELLDERDHEGGHYAYDDDKEEGWLDDGLDVGVGMDSGTRWF